MNQDRSNRSNLSMSTVNGKHVCTSGVWISPPWLPTVGEGHDKRTPNTRGESRGCGHFQPACMLGAARKSGVSWGTGLYIQFEFLNSKARVSIASHFALQRLQVNYSNSHHWHHVIVRWKRPPGIRCACAPSPQSQTAILGPGQNDAKNAQSGLPRSIY